MGGRLLTWFMMDVPADRILWDWSYRERFTIACILWYWILLGEQRWVHQRFRDYVSSWRDLRTGRRRHHLIRLKRNRGRSVFKVLMSLWECWHMGETHRRARGTLSIDAASWACCNTWSLSILFIPWRELNPSLTRSMCFRNFVRPVWKQNQSFRRFCCGRAYGSNGQGMSGMFRFDKRIDQNLRLCRVVDPYWLLMRSACWPTPVGVSTAVVLP